MGGRVDVDEDNDEAEGVFVESRALDGGHMGRRRWAFLMDLMMYIGVDSGKTSKGIRVSS